MTRQNQDPTPAELPIRSFDESIQLDDEKPFPTWVPSPKQIRKFGRQIRLENFTARLDTEQYESIQRVLADD